MASIIDPVVIAEDVDPIVQLDQEGQMLPDLQYQKQRPIFVFQLIFIYALIFLKYGTYFTKIKFKGFQIKLFGSLLLCQCLMIHQKTSYALIWQEFEMKSLLDAVIVGVLFTIAFLHMTRLTHLIPDSWRGQYQLMAQRVMQRNEEELQLTNAATDIVYENAVTSPADSDISDFLTLQDDSGLMDTLFSILDFVIQISVAILFTLNFLTKEGAISTLSPETALYATIQRYGLTKSISLVAFFCLSHINQSRYVGLSKWDSVQYFLIRALIVSLPFLIIVRSDYSGTIRHHFEQLLLAIFYLGYFAIIDWHNSRKNQLALFFEDMLNKDLNSEIGDGNNNYAERNQYRVVLIMFRPDGRGGIQGIVLDSFYMDADGNIANEFYLVSDATNGEIKKIEDSSIR